MKIGRWQLDAIHGGAFSIDGGAAFGVVPKNVWKRIHPADENNLVRMTCNCLLARDGEHTVLIDTGYGNKYPPLDKKSYKMEDGLPVVDDLVRFGIQPNDVDYLLFTHLHFDHAGGATRKDESGQLVPTFCQARHWVHRLEWEDAFCAEKELIAAYPQDNLIPLSEAKMIETFDGNEITLLPGLKAIRTGGHTRGHTAFLFESEDGNDNALFIGDLCVTRAHIKMLWNLSYDTFLLETRRKKRQLLENAAESGGWVFFAHDPFVTACRLEKHPQREFVITESLQR